MDHLGEQIRIHVAESSSKSVDFSFSYWFA